MGFLLYTMCFIALSAILWKISSVARCILKFLIFGISSFIFACGPIPIMLLKPRDSRNALIPAALLRAISKPLGLNYKVEGHENIIKGSGCVVLINHQSAIDLFILAYLWPIMPNSTAISKKEIFYIQPFGLASWLWGTIFIDRVNAKDAQSAINKTGETIRQRQARVLMFPEGTRSSGKDLLPFKKGAFHLAIASKVPIQPVVVSRYTFLGMFRFDSGDIKIKILPAISTEGYTTENLPSLIDKTYQIMNKTVNEISANNEVNGLNRTKKSN